MLNARAIAKVCHQANMALCEVTGDWTHRSWESLPLELQESAIEGVERARGGVSPREQHESWLANRLANGWRCGIVKSDELKTHPCMVDYDQLPIAQRRKNELFMAIVKALT